MYVIVCKELQKKYDFFLWNERKGNQRLSNDYLKEMIEEIDEMQEKYYLSTGVKVLLFDLAEKGQAVSDNQIQIKVVEEVLEESGYTYKREQIHV